MRSHSPAPKPARRHPNHTFNAAQIAIAEAAAIAALTTPPPLNATAAAIGSMTVCPKPTDTCQPAIRPQAFNANC